MAEITKKSRMAIVAESTEGTAAFPASGADFLALQEGFSATLGFETLENAELRASIGSAQSINGFESPAASISHYLRHSGTEGQAPQSGYSKLLKAAFGSEEVNGTQYDTVSGSTTTVVNVDTGEGANFAIGEAILIKHASLPWEIGVIKSISSDALTMLFTLDNAPGTGVNLGKAVSYRAADSGHVSLSVHDYRGNGGAYQLIAGARVTSLSIEGTAGELLNASFELEGVAGYFDPIRIQAADTKLDFTETGPTVRAATIAAGVYKTPHALAAAIQAAMNAVATDNYTVTYSDSTGKFTIATDGSLLSLLWNTGTNTANTIGDKIGFSVAADDTGALTYTSDNAQDWSSPYTPAFDSPGAPLVVKNNKIMIGDQSDNVCFPAQTMTYTLGTPKTDIISWCAETGKSGSIINERTVSMSITATLERHKADLFQKIVDNGSVAVQASFGTKTAGNWDAGKSGCLHIKDASVSAHNLGDSDGLVTLEIEVQGFVDSSGNSETALNLL